MSQIVDIADFRDMFRDAVTRKVADCVECHFAFLIGSEGDLTILELLGLNNLQQRKAIQEMVRTMQSVLVLHACEIWFTSLEKNDPRQAETDAAHQRHELHKLSWVKEGVYLFAEALSSPLTIERATIIRSKDKEATLSAWEPMISTAPRPTWRRYFPESVTTVGPAN